MLGFSVVKCARSVCLHLFSELLLCLGISSAFFLPLSVLYPPPNGKEMVFTVEPDTSHRFRVPQERQKQTLPFPPFRPELIPSRPEAILLEAFFFEVTRMEPMSTAYLNILTPPLTGSGNVTKYTHTSTKKMEKEKHLCDL